jgi:hypothetical protein
VALVIGSDPVGVIQNFLPTATNILNYSQSFSTTVDGWHAGNSTVTSSSIPAPDGTMTAWQIADTLAGGYLDDAQSIVGTSSYYTFSVYVATTSGTQTGELVIYDETAGFTIAGSQVFTATTTWQRIVCTTTAAFTGGDTIIVYIYPGGLATEGTIQAWGAQLEATSYATPYIATTSAPVTVTSNANGTAPSETTASLANPGRKEYSAATTGGLFSFPENVYNKSVTLVGYELVLGGQSTWTLAITDGITNATSGDVAIGSGTTETTVVSPDIPGLVLFPGQDLRLTTTGTASHNYWRCTIKVAYTLSESGLWI